MLDGQAGRGSPGSRRCRTTQSPQVVVEQPAAPGQSVALTAIPVEIVVAHNDHLRRY